MKNVKEMYEDFCKKVAENDACEETLNATNCMLFGERLALTVATAAIIARYGKQMTRFEKCCRGALLIESAIYCYQAGTDIKRYYEKRLKYKD